MREPSTPESTAWRRNLPVLAATQLLTVASMSVVLPFLPFFVRELGVVERAAVERWSGLIFSGPFLAAGLMSPVWGYLGDRYGHRPMVIRAIAGLAVVNFLYMLVQTPFQFWILRLLQGMVTGFIPAALAITSASTPRERLPDSLGKLQASASAGRLIGPLIGGLLAGFLPFRSIFLVVGCTISLSMIAVILFLREPPPQPAARNSSPWQNIRFAMADPHMRGGLAGLFVMMSAASMVMPIFPLYVEDRFGVEAAAVWTGIGFAVVAAFTMIGAWVVGRITERVGLKRVLVTGLSLTAVSLALHPFAGGAASLLAVRALLGLGVAGVQPALISMISRRAPPGRGGGITGLASSATIFGFFVGPGTGGWLANHVGVSGVFFVAASITVACAVVAASVTRRTGRGREIVALPNQLPR